MMAVSEGTPDSKKAPGLVLEPLFAGESRAAIAAYYTWRDRLHDYASRNPVETLFFLVTGSAMILYLAEREVNEGIDSYDDALYYISTCLSVGYANVFPTTQLGKLVAAMVMMVGPGLSAWLVESKTVSRHAQEAAAKDEHGALLEKLEAILQELRRHNHAAAA